MLWFCQSTDGHLWNRVCCVCVHPQAEEFHSVVHALLEWLAEAEQTLRFHGVLPDDEDALRTLIDQHKVSNI